MNKMPDVSRFRKFIEFIESVTFIQRLFVIVCGTLLLNFASNDVSSEVQNRSLRIRLLPYISIWTVFLLIYFIKYVREVLLPKATAFSGSTELEAYRYPRRDSHSYTARPSPQNSRRSDTLYHTGHPDRAGPNSDLQEFLDFDLVGQSVVENDEKLTFLFEHLRRCVQEGNDVRLQHLVSMIRHRSLEKGSESTAARANDSLGAVEGSSQPQPLLPSTDLAARIDTEPAPANDFLGAVEGSAQPQLLSLLPSTHVAVRIDTDEPVPDVEVEFEATAAFQYIKRCVQERNDVDLQLLVNMIRHRSPENGCANDSLRAFEGSSQSQRLPLLPSTPTILRIDTDEPVPYVEEAYVPTAVIQGSKNLHRELGIGPQTDDFELNKMRLQFIETMRRARIIDKDCTLQIGSFVVLKYTDSGPKWWSLQNQWTPTITSIHRSRWKLFALIFGTPYLSYEVASPILAYFTKFYSVQ
jgi:hypothetical protein